MRQCLLQWNSVFNDVEAELTLLTAIRTDRASIETALRNLAIGVPKTIDPKATGPEVLLGYKHDPTFLGLPLELRNHIYGYLLTIDKSPEFTPDARRWENNFGHLGLLCVNQQIRAEAWDVLKTTNILVNVTVVTEANKPVKPNLLHGVKDQVLVQPYIQPSLFGASKAEELRICSALHIWIGESCGKDDANKTGPYRNHHNMMFIYSTRTYGFFCDELAARVDEFKSISVDVNPRPPATSFNFVLQKLMMPLKVIRGADRVCFRNIMKVNLFANMAKGMMKRYHSAEEMTKTLTLFKDKGNEYYKAGKYAAAICHYWFGKQAIKHLLEIARKNSWEVGSPAMNGFYHVEADLESNMAQAHHMLMLARKVNGKIRDIHGWQLNNAIGCAEGAMGWAGILDDQRGKAHFRRAVAFMDKAEYLVQFSGKLSKEEIVQAKWTNAVQCYEQAALDFYHAIQIDFKTKNMEMLQSLYEMCRKKGEVKKDPEVQSLFVPGIGQWKGDPRLFQKWQTHSEFFMVSLTFKLWSLCPPVFLVRAVTETHTNIFDSIDVYAQM